MLHLSCIRCASTTTTSSSFATPVLTMYRRLLKQAARLPAPDAATTVHQIRAAFRAGAAGATDAASVEAALATAASKLGYLRMVTPRDGGEGGATRYVVRNGEVVEAGGGGARPPRATSNWSGTNLDPEAVSRHQRSLERFRFGGRK